MKDDIAAVYETRANVGFLAFTMLAAFALLGWFVGDLDGRIESLERIVGTETPASMTWTNGHTYTQIMKHSANCPCVKK